MKVILAAVNAKYIHSNLAVFSLRAYAVQHGQEAEIARVYDQSSARAYHDGSL